MHYIVALGNPGEKYSNTRHNVGWLALDYVSEKIGFSKPVESASFSGRVAIGVIGNNELSVLYPDTFMNNSGTAVAKFVPKNKIENLIVIHDDIDLPFGEIKIGVGRGAGGNQGIRSIIEKLDSNKFVRVRVGIAPKSFWTGKTKRPQGGGPLERFVLKSFSTSESKQLPEVFEKVKTALETIVTDGVEVAMNRLN